MGIGQGFKRLTVYTILLSFSKLHVLEEVFSAYMYGVNLNLLLVLWIEWTIQWHTYLLFTLNAW